MAEPNTITLTVGWDETQQTLTVVQLEDKVPPGSTIIWQGDPVSGIEWIGVYFVAYRLSSSAPWVGFVGNQPTQSSPSEAEWTDPNQPDARYQYVVSAKVGEYGSVMILDPKIINTG